MIDVVPNAIFMINRHIFRPPPTHFTITLTLQTTLLSMKNITLLTCFMLSSLFLQSQDITNTADIALTPRPTSIWREDGYFFITSKTIIAVPNNDVEYRRIAQLLVDRLKIDGTKVSIVDVKALKTDKNVIFLNRLSPKASADMVETTADAVKTPLDEGYKLTISKTQIYLTTSNAAGLFYGVQTLLQLLPADIYGTKTIRKMSWKMPCLSIDDKPAYSYRGMHLDVARHFFPVSFVKKYIDLLAMHKFNTFHWHLTDDQGWRIEIKRYPKLTSIGGYRKETLIGHYGNTPQRFDGTRYGGFYTQAEIREVVAYAAARYVTIIPEIEMPGHALAALSAYPELGCDSTRIYTAATKWGVFDDVFCPSDTTFTFLQNVLSEVMDIFPSKYIHIGGDECPKKAWEKSAFCQNLMRANGLKDEHELQSYFIRRIEKYVNSKGRRIIGWDEILEGGLAPDATVMSWRGTEGGIAAARQQHNVIMTPGTHCYFDHYQANPATEPVAIGGFTSLEKVYAYNPTPDSLAENARYILGAQGNVWTEYMTTPDYVEYMAFPRACALSEVLWTNIGRNYEQFVQRLPAHFARLDRLNVNYAKRLYDVKASLSVINSTPSVSLTSAATSGNIHYTIDGTEPKLTSATYRMPITINKVTTIKASLFQNNKLASSVTTQKFYVHSALGMTYNFATPPKNTYDSGVNGLTNGVRGTMGSYGEWVGFNGNDMEMTLDFTTPRPFRSVTLSFLNKPSAWIFLPDFVTISVSNDGIEWLDIDRSDFAHNRSNDKTSIRETKLTVSEYTSPKRYMRIYAKSIGICPKGHAGEGQTAWLFADEVIVE